MPPHASWRAPPPPRLSSRVARRRAASIAPAPRAFFDRRAPSPSSSSSSFTLFDLEREIASAPPSTSREATSVLSLPDAVWKVTKDVPLSLRDRAACVVAAEAVQTQCDLGLDGASLVVALAVREALRRNGFDGPGTRVRSGYVSRGAIARAHAWLEIDGRVLDVCDDGLALCEAARRAKVDYGDARAMREAFGDDALLAGEYSPKSRRPLTVLDVKVPVGGVSMKTSAAGLTLTPPPSNVAGAAEAVATNEKFRRVPHTASHTTPFAWCTPFLKKDFAGALSVALCRPMKHPRHQITNQSHHFPPHHPPIKRPSDASWRRRRGGGRMRGRASCPKTSWTRTSG